MQVNDPVYGSFEVRERVMLELMASAPMQRIRGVSQQGIPNDGIKQEMPYYSRFDHCVGVMLLLKKLGAPLEEQVAGLLHDVSHTAFSHVADWVFGSVEAENYQDSIHKDYIIHSELKRILESNDLDPERIAHLETFPLLERELPMLCADRVDYALKDFHYYYDYDVNAVVNGLRSYKDEIVFDSKRPAQIFGEGYMRCQEEIWGSDRRKTEYEILAQAIKIGFDAGVITADDLLHRGDLEVTGMLEEAQNEEINKRLRALRSGLKYSRSDRGSIPLRKKYRYVDPKYFEGGKLLRLSETDANFEKMLRTERARMEERVRVDVIYD